MRAIRVLSLSSLLLATACAPSPPPGPRGPFELSNGPEPGTVPRPTLSPLVHTTPGGKGVP